MPRVCTVCAHPKRAEIDRQLANGEGVKCRIAARNGLQESAIRRHAALHLSPALLKAAGESKEQLAKEALEHCRWLVQNARSQAEGVLERSQATRHVVCTLCGQRPDPFKDWIDPLNRAIQNLGKFTGELANDQVSALLIEVGARDAGELRSRLDLTRALGDVSVDELLDEHLAGLAMALPQRPGRVVEILALIERLGYVNGGTHAIPQAQLPAFQGREAGGQRPSGEPGNRENGAPHSP